MNYELVVIETNNKAGKYHYIVKDETGKVISQRKSNKQYVACTINGQFYFGRLDLIGKGDHGRQINALRRGTWSNEKNDYDGIPIPPVPIAYKK